MCFNHHSAFGYSSEEVILGQVAGVEEVEELKGFEEEGVDADFGGCFELYLLE